MAVRCAGCGRLSREESVCEWCRSEIPPEGRQMTAAGIAGRGAAVGPEGSIRAGDSGAVDEISRPEAAGAVAGAAAAWRDAHDGELPAAAVSDGAPAEERVEE